MGVGGFCKVVSTFNLVGRSFNLFMATTGDVWIIPSFQIWDYVLHVELISSIITDISESSLLSKYVFRLCWRKTLPENYYPYLKTCFSKFCYSMLLSLYFYQHLFSLLSSGWFGMAVCGYTVSCSLNVWWQGEQGRTFQLCQPLVKWHLNSYHSVPL